MWILRLNDMRSSKSEYLTAVCKAETKGELLELLERERVASYIDPIENPIPATAWAEYPTKWYKNFRKGGPLEWYNPPFDLDSRDHFTEVQELEDVIKQQLALIEQQMREQLSAQYRTLVTNVPLLNDLPQ